MLSARRMGLGLAALGRPGYINLGHADDLGVEKSVDALEARAQRVLDAAWAAGVRYFDAARSYGRAEQFLANWIARRGITARQIFVASKWGYRYTADWQVQAAAHEIKEHSLAHVRSQYRESQALLGEQLDLYQIHSATLASGVLADQQILDELARLKASGLQIGLSLSGPQQGDTLEKALSIERDGLPLFDAVQATWNILNPAAGPTLQAAHQRGLRVIVKEALANGRLTTRNTQPDFAKKLRILNAFAQKRSTTVDALAIAAVLAQPWAAVVLSGAARVDHLESNMQALELNLNAAELKELLELSEDNDAYWKTRSELAWN